ncbi:MAG: hypothetical protein FWG74_02230 [Planctomycetes bacterium]|nr:hypothetical protein [Planctomycetota bacterium]
MRKAIWHFLAAFVLAAVPVWSGEGDDLAQAVRRYELANDELRRALRELDYPEPVSEYPSRLLSSQNNASIAIGGEIRTNYISSRAGLAEPGFGAAPSGAAGKARLADLKLTTGKLAFDARVRNRWQARIEINLNGYDGVNRQLWTRNPNVPGEPASSEYQTREWWDYLGEAGLEMLKQGHSGFGFKVGLFKPSFGLKTRPDLIGRAYMDAPDLAESYLLGPLAYGNGVRLPHASRFLEPVFAAMVNYEMRDIIRFEAGVFQERYDYPRRAALVADAGAEMRSDAPLPRSWQFGFSFLPLEGWELSATFRNRYSRTRGIRYWADSPYREDFRQNLASGNGDPAWDAGEEQWTDGGAGPGFGSRRNAQDFIVGVALEIPNTRLAVQLEYAHGWNQGFNKHIYSDNLNLGLSYRVTPFLTLFGQAEWLRVMDRSWLAAAGGTWARDSRKHRLQRFLLGAEYELYRGATLEAGWQYEYWRVTSAQGGADGARDERISQANMFYVGSRFIF